MKDSCDVLIVGGGLVGSAMALLLARQTDLQIVVLESQPVATFNTDMPWQLRVSAINASSKSLLTEIDVWQNLHPQRLGAFDSMQVWEQNSQIDFAAADIGADWLGHIIENQHLQWALHQQLSKQPTVKQLHATAANLLEDQTLTLTNVDSITAPLIIAADGGQSQIRDWAGIKSHGWAYHQQGLVAVVETELPHQQCARQHFLPGGPLAFLPLADPHLCSIVWTVPDAEADRLTALDETAFTTQLASHFLNRTGKIKLVSQRASFPLQLQHASQYVKSGMALIGDAAHSVHPLAGQGVNLGFQDAAVLSQIIADAHNRGRQLGSLQSLKKYQRARRADNLLMQFSLDGMNRLFASQMPGMPFIRRFGLSQLNQCQPLKNLFIRQAAGSLNR